MGEPLMSKGGPGCLQTPEMDQIEGCDQTIPACSRANSVALRGMSTLEQMTFERGPSMSRPAPIQPGSLPLLSLVPPVFSCLQRMAEARRRWRTLLALGAGVAAAGSVYYIYRRWCEDQEREARELSDARSPAAGAGSGPSTPVAHQRTPGRRGELAQEAHTMNPATPVSEVRAHNFPAPPMPECFLRGNHLRVGC